MQLKVAGCGRAGVRQPGGLQRARKIALPARMVRPGKGMPLMLQPARRAGRQRDSGQGYSAGDCGRIGQREG